MRDPQPSDLKPAATPRIGISDLLAAAGECESLALKVDATIKSRACSNDAIRNLNTMRCVLWQAAVYLHAEAEAANIRS